MTPETRSPGTVAAQPPVTRPTVDVSSIDKAIHDQLTADLGLRVDPGDPGSKVERAWLLYTYLDSRTFAVVLHWLVSRRRNSLDTKRGYADDLLKLARWLCKRTNTAPAHLLNDLDNVTVTNWVTWATNQGLSDRTQRRTLSAVSSLFNYAIAHGVDVRNPVNFEDHTNPTTTDDQGRPDKAARVLSLTEAAAMRDQCRTPGEHFAFDLMLAQGLRESEVVKLGTGDVDTTGNPTTVTVTRKGGRRVVRNLDADTAAHLTAHLVDQEPGPIFTYPRTGAPRSRHYLIRLTRRLAKDAEVANPETVTPHVLRATAITGLLDDGKPLHEVQKWAGHQDSATTQGYWDRTNAPKRDAALSAALTAKLRAASAGIGL